MGLEGQKGRPPSEANRSTSGERARCWLCELREKPQRRAVGLMSGTSADGIDVAVVDLMSPEESPPFRLIAFRTWPYDQETRRAVLEMAHAGRSSLQQLARLNVRLGELFAEAVLHTLRDAGLPREEIDFIGSHGQTVGHFPKLRRCLGRLVRATLQIGEPDMIAKRTGILTVGDFRVGDVALGGSGAPLVPLVDWLFFRSPDRCVATLNIGGIANVTIIPKNAGLEDVLGFDTGPGNALLNSLAELYWEEPADWDGRHAAAGRVDEEWLSHLLRHPYFRKLPPKSTGREVFGMAMAKRLAEEGDKRGLSPEDVLATATLFVARSIARSLETLLPHADRPELLICSGGGVHNPTLMAQLRRELAGMEIHTSQEVGVDPDAKEAIAFAVLADRTLRGEAGNCPGATGAGRSGILGKICLP